VIENNTKSEFSFPASSQKINFSGLRSPEQAFFQASKIIKKKKKYVLYSVQI